MAGSAHEVTKHGEGICKVQALLNDLKSCSVRRDLQWGRLIHEEVVQTGNASNIYVSTALVKMYAKCGSMLDARQVFDSIKKPDVISWNTLLFGYAENGEGRVSLELFFKLKCVPNSLTYIAALKACTSLGLKGNRTYALAKGAEIHLEIGDRLNPYVQNTLMEMYAKCGSMFEARRVFDSIPRPTIVSWTVLMLGYAENGEGHVSLELLSKMKAAGCVPDSVTHVAALKACKSLAANGGAQGRAQALETGRAIHLEINDHLNAYVQSALIDMYATCGSMVDARQVFDSIKKPSVVSWNALLLGYAENGEGQVLLELFSKMKADGCPPDAITYVAALKGCSLLARHGEKAVSLQIGNKIHLETGDHLDIYVQSALVDMYANCGCMTSARQVFDSVKKPDVVTWNALLLGYAANGEGNVSLELFSKMKADGCVPDSVTFVSVLKACTSLAENGDESGKTQGLEVGSKIHLEIGSHLNTFVQNTLIDMYAKCGVMSRAREVFNEIQNPDVVSWNALLSGYEENGQEHVCLELFFKMKAVGCAPDSLTYVAALKACSSLAVNGNRWQSLEWGSAIHVDIGDSSDQYVRNTLIDMYSKCGSISEARQVFDSIQKPDVVSWNALLLGYAENGQGHVSLELLFKMKADGCTPDSVTYAAALKACLSLGALSLGQRVHSEISEFTIHLVTCLVDFYAKCGSMAEARAVFDMHSRSRDVSTWNALLAGYSTHGDTASVFRLFGEMRDEVRPNTVTFLCILLCCCHAGLAEKAKEYLGMMPAYGLAPTVMHYTCLVDTLGRANQLQEAISVLRRVPCELDAVIWMTLLSSCRRWKNVAVGTWAFESLVYMDIKNASVYVLMAHIYGSHGMWKEQARVLRSSAKHKLF